MRPSWAAPVSVGDARPAGVIEDHAAGQTNAAGPCGSGRLSTHLRVGCAAAGPPEGGLPWSRHHSNTAGGPVFRRARARPWFRSEPTLHAPSRGRPARAAVHPARFAGTSTAAGTGVRGEDHDAGSGPRDHGRVSLAPERVDEVHGRRERRPPEPLVQPVPRRRQQEVGTPGHRLDEQRRAARVEGGVDVVDVRGKDGPCGMRRQLLAGYEDDRRDLGMGRDRCGAGRGRRGVVGVAAPRHRHAAEDARRGVVGVALELGREVGGHVEVDVDDGPGSVRASAWRSESTCAATTPATMADGRRPEAAAVRDAVPARRGRGRRACASRAGRTRAPWRGRRGACSSRGTSSAPSPETDDLQTVALADTDVVLVPQPEGEPDRVEPRAEVGACWPGRGCGPRAQRRACPCSPVEAERDGRGHRVDGHPHRDELGPVGPAQRPLRVLEAVPRDRADDPRARRARVRPRARRAGRRPTPPTRARRRRPPRTRPGGARRGSARR